MSLQVGANSTRRIGVDYAQRQFVVFDEHAAGMFHGHVRSWGDLTQAMQATLRRAGMMAAETSFWVIEIVPLIEALLADEQTSGKAQDALDDIRTFLAGQALS